MLTGKSVDDSTNMFAQSDNLPVIDMRLAVHNSNRSFVMQLCKGNRVIHYLDSITNSEFVAEKLILVANKLVLVAEKFILVTEKLILITEKFILIAKKLILIAKNLRCR